jgi:hypothetical protein
MGGLRRVGRNLKRRRHVEAYAVVAVSATLAVLSLVGDVVDDGVRWAAVLAALSLLVFHVTLPETTSDFDDVLHNRSAFDEVPFASRLQGAREVWIVAPTAVALLNQDTTRHLRDRVLSRPDGRVRVVVLDPERTDAVELAHDQLDRGLSYPGPGVAESLAGTVNLLDIMASWDVAGTVEHRFAPFSPGFSIVAINPHAKGGTLIVEVHGARNESLASRMHLELTRARSEQWFVYWRDQLHHLWDRARTPS